MPLAHPQFDHPGPPMSTLVVVPLSLCRPPRVCIVCGLVFVPRRPALHAFHKALKLAPFVKLSQGYALYGNNEVAIVHLTLGCAMLGTPANLDWTFTRTLEGWNVEKPWDRKVYSLFRPCGKWLCAKDASCSIYFWLNATLAWGSHSRVCNCAINFTWNGISSWRRTTQE